MRHHDEDPAVLQRNTRQKARTRCNGTLASWQPHLTGPAVLSVVTYSADI
ncbi:hypothetical protein TPY_3653 [Sulfobacillus acidophilus TPY]|nr:hypothetical protein TPY_3653 [Sulfobacillus acidophilus TPY]